MSNNPRTPADEPTALYITPDGTLATVDGDRPVTCSWFALCDRPAVTLAQHPALGGVPICQPCANKLETLKG